jgi:meiotically up-regulated gene 157 (Mug157) protein
MAMAIQGLTEDEPDRHVEMAFQLRQLVLSATNDAMHESVHHSNPQLFTREWFEWVSLMALCIFWSSSC